MDKLDLEILNALRFDARKPFLEIAKKLGVADATIHARVKKMIKEGIIKGFETVVDDGKLGYKITSFIEIKVKPETVDEAVIALSKIDGVLEVHEMHGHCDILLKVKAKGLAELRDKLVKEIRAIKEVISSKAHTVMKVVKEEHSLPIIRE